MGASKFHIFKPGCVIEAKGPDTLGFLQGQFSNDLSKAADGGAVYGLWLDRKGKILADSFALRRTDESFLLASYASGEELVMGRLSDYLIMDEVELAGASGRYVGRALFGEAIAAARERLGIALPEKDGWRDEAGLIVFWGRRGSEECLEILFDVACFGEGALAEFDATLEAEGAQRVGDEAMLALSVRSGVPRIGREFGGSDLPQELGLDRDAVSFRKGCYLGQEVMARLQSMGRARKTLRRVEILGTEALLSIPADLLDENGKRQGALRAVVYSDDGGEGLAVISTGFKDAELTAGGVVVRLVGSDGHE